ncbi:MAG: response regulator [Leptolyngbyaceae cyanobacterium bins.302]|nr:response regulator [Leptolyngbyaceae cyanobacterium bins.302]
MSAESMVSYRSSQSSSQQLHPLSLFAEITSHAASGCLQITSAVTCWWLFFDQGRLSFASNSINPFERFDRQLSQLSLKVPALVSAVRAQARSQFERVSSPQSLIPGDYLAMRWLLKQQYLNEEQVAELAQELAKEVIESLLRVTEGQHRFIESHAMPDYKPLCQLELRPLVEYCQAQLRQQSIARSPILTFQEPVTPIAPGITPAQVPSAEAEQPLSPSTVNGLKSHYTIACIDDSPTVLQAIHSFLEDANLSIVMINDPLKALIQIIRCKPDLILLDVGMPNLDGYELCSMLRRHPNFKHTPIVMVTGNTGFIDRAKARLVGASGYLTKPFTRPDLMKMVFKHLT